MTDPVLKYYDEVLFIVVVLGFLSYIGNFIAKKILGNRGKLSNQNDETEAFFQNGQLIGTLERLLIFIAILIQEWSLVGIVVALKTIARYKELDDQNKAEYFLIGSLFSLLWAVSIGVLVLLLIKETGCFEQLKFLVDDKTMNVKIL
ncbi:MAG: hypothetical protein AB7U44_00255 [Sulfuricurvum sp.]|uniref:hypothetical protein n=1 Tax=Sulfuricurvum sp. TaxID=2025608 RepID=UPI002602ED3C|nr:hypothetical protein [Sulfuricurvum sp.]MDD2839364.1 hypothetical protein [Sulfuricurvum sp.]MDD3595420.1 hypothetical protein [Sulfuricurvum sp.]MDD4884771.1 hypothetical protein [Sulfuricurvum sp.]